MKTICTFTHLSRAPYDIIIISRVLRIVLDKHFPTHTHMQVCHEAAMGPIRELGPAALLSVKAEDVRALEEKVRNRLNFISLIELSARLCLYCIHQLA